MSFLEECIHTLQFTWTCVNTAAHTLLYMKQVGWNFRTVGLGPLLKGQFECQTKQTPKTPKVPNYSCEHTISMSLKNIYIYQLSANSYILYYEMFLLIQLVLKIFDYIWITGEMTPKPTYTIQQRNYNRLKTELHHSKKKRKKENVSKIIFAR